MSDAPNPDPGSTGFRIRAATKADLAELVRLAGEGGASSWSRAAFAAELGNRAARLWVAIEGSDETIIGFLDCWVVKDEVQLQNIAIQKDKRRRGVGRALLEHMLTSVRGTSVTRVELEVRHGNVEALAFYLKVGFDGTGRRPRYYADTGEDAILMRLELGKPPG